MKRGKRPILDHFLLPWEDGGSIGNGQMGLMQLSLIFTDTQNVLFSDSLKWPLSKLTLMWIHKVEYPSKSADSCSLRRERTAPGISPGVSERTRFSLEPSGIKRWILQSLLLLNSLFYLTSVWRATKLHVRREEQPGGTEQPEVRIMMSFAGAQTQTAILAAVGGSRARASAPTGMTLN